MCIAIGERHWLHDQTSWQAPHSPLPMPEDDALIAGLHLNLRCLALRMKSKLQRSIWLSGSSDLSHLNPFNAEKHIECGVDSKNLTYALQALQIIRFAPRLIYGTTASQTSTGDIVDMEATLLNTAKTYLQVFATLDPESIMPILSETYLHDFAPASANPPPQLNRETFTAHIKKIKEILSTFPVTAKQFWINPTNKQVTIWADSVTHFYDHLKDNADNEEWLYHGEYIFLLSMDASGQQVEHVFEFLDSKGTERLFGLFARARKRRAELDAAT